MPQHTFTSITKRNTGNVAIIAANITKIANTREPELSANEPIVMWKKSFAISLAALAILVCAAAPNSGRHQAPPNLPPAVQKTIDARLGDGQLQSVEKKAEDGAVAYDVEMTLDGRTRDFTVAEDGKLINEQMFLNELPAAVRKTIQSQTA